MDVDQFPYQAPARTCNARLARQAGYCRNVAGKGTEHEGRGRCSLHGGAETTDDIPDSPFAVLRSAGLERLIDIALTLTEQDEELEMKVGNSGLVLARTLAVARMLHPDTTAQEMDRLSATVARIDSILSKHTNEDDPDAAPNMMSPAEMAAAAAVAELEKQFSS